MVLIKSPVRHLGLAFEIVTTHSTRLPEAGAFTLLTFKGENDSVE